MQRRTDLSHLFAIGEEFAAQILFISCSLPLVQDQEDENASIKVIRVELGGFVIGLTEGFDESLVLGFG
jgi:hypothetical protein